MLPAKITRLLLTAGTLRLLLPQWMRLPLTLWRYRHFFAEGIRALMNGRPGVPVLDALAIGGRAVGAGCLRDPLRPEAAEVISNLRTLGLKNILQLTGDTVQSTVPVAQALGITDYFIGMSPEQKAAIVCKLRDRGHKIIMVGDGVNDSPAMTYATAAVSMKDAADLAREVADITLLENSLSGLVDLRRLSVAALRRIHSNYRFIAAFNSALIAAGAFGVFPPLLSAWLHNLSTVGVCVTGRRSFE